MPNARSPAPRRVLAYLSRNTHRVAISHRRLIALKPTVTGSPPTTVVKPQQRSPSAVDAVGERSVQRSDGLGISGAVRPLLNKRNSNGNRGSNTS